jgi:hypothetical protein
MKGPGRDENTEAWFGKMALRPTWRTFNGVTCYRCGRVLSAHVNQIYCPDPEPEKPEAA